MTWESFYLTCFLGGLVLTTTSLLLGAHVHLPFHLPHWHFGGGHHGSAGHGAGNQGTGGHGHSLGLGPVNMTTVLVFLTWFGATGYLVTHYHSASVGLALMASTAVGFAGGTAMYLFVIRSWMARERPLRAGDFEMVGVLGKLSLPIREQDGTGELIYSQHGTRRSCGARSEGGSRIERGTEVVVMRFDKGIAYVRSWDDLQRNSLT
jgi:membrane protein implicated in regulation of membrane protease activity